MRYLSLFSGIGGFELAINQVYGEKAVCVGYSEIDRHAIQEYERHYPHHKNLGDVNKITKKAIYALGKIDLIVGGFPCNDLSSAGQTGRLGLEGAKSGLFWVMLKIIKWTQKNNQNLKIIIENNASMAHKWRDVITSELSKIMKENVVCNYFDSSQWVLQRRRRYYWTLNKIPTYVGPRLHNMSDVLISVKEARQYALTDKAIKYINGSPSHLHGDKGEYISKIGNCYEKVHVCFPTRLHNFKGSSTKDTYIKCINTLYDGAVLLDYRMCPGANTFIPRHLAKQEFNKLFGFPDNYVLSNSKSIFARLYGMTVVPSVIKHILLNI